MKLRLSLKARANLKDIRIYTQKTHGKGQAQKYVKAVRKGLALLPQNPYMGYIVESHRAVYRCLNIESHRAFYRITKSEIVVIAILHQSQEPERHISQRDKFE